MKQDANTRLMIFRIPELIADLSAGITLEPGDIIATGTPAGTYAITITGTSGALQHTATVQLVVQ